MLQTDYTGPKDLYQCSPKPRGPCVSTAHHHLRVPLPALALRVVVRINPFGIHSTREPGPYWGYSGNQPLSLPHRLPGQEEADKFNTRAKGDESQNNNA